ncbi:ABC transporter transmembrane domain-containing protein [Lactobacillus delbrueckii]|uniref:ABC transporter transmembrane domain-containing protein n=1 Tax=Lactobacillus delbrueckii TaxID=1584 RepID=UPI00288B9373|nr:ABC transporter transmembrane domain-containing protein [Lactobacillus delbrueckii]
MLLLGSLLDQVTDYFWELHLEKYFHQIRQEVLAHAYAEAAGTKENLQNELTNDLEMLKEQYADSIGGIVHSAVLLALVAGSLASFRWSLLLLVIAVSALQMYLPRVLDEPLQKATDKISASNRKYLQTLADWLNGIDTLRRYAVGEKFLSIIHADARELESAYVKQQKADQELEYLNQAIYSLGNMLIFLLTAYFVARGQLEFCLIASVNDFSLYLFGSLMNIANYRG